MACCRHGCAHRGKPTATEVAPVTLVVGEEEYLVDRAVRDLIAAARGPARWSIEPPQPPVEHRQRSRDPLPAGDLHDLDSSELGPGQLESLTSPSLFGGGCVLVVRAAQNASKEVAAELARYVKSPAPDVVLVLTHAGGAKGKELLAAVKAAGSAGDRVPEAHPVRRAARLHRASSAGRAGGPTTAPPARCWTRSVGPARARGRLRPARRRHRGPASTRPSWPGTTGAGPRRPASPSPTGRSRGSCPRRWSSCAGRWRPAPRRC